MSVLELNFAVSNLTTSLRHVCKLYYHLSPFYLVFSLSLFPVFFLRSNLHGNGAMVGLQQRACGRRTGWGACRLARRRVGGYARVAGGAPKNPTKSSTRISVSVKSNMNPSTAAIALQAIHGGQVLLFF